MPDMQALNENGESVVMLLYLNEDTWMKQGEALERDVRAARKLHSGLKILMVHENEKGKGGCEFSDIIGTTPQELIDYGIYRSACTLNRRNDCCSVRHVRRADARCALWQ